MTSIATDRAEIWKHRDRVPYHLAQFEEPYRSTVHLARFIRSVTGAPGGTALDVACGAGANIHHLGAALPGYRWTGVDLAGEELFPLGRPFFERWGEQPELVTGDFYRLREALGGRRFDLVLFMQTLNSVPYGYEPLMAELLGVTRGWLFISALFTDSRVDARIEAMDYTRSEDCQGPFFYNVYAMDRLRDWCMRAGSPEVIAADFEIDVDLPPPAHGGLQTYTRRLADGTRLQISGPLLMPWKFVAVRGAA